jgi:hypothetical protein
MEIRPYQRLKIFAVHDTKHTVRVWIMNAQTSPKKPDSSNRRGKNGESGRRATLWT